MSVSGQRRTNFKPKPYRLTGISNDEILEGRPAVSVEGLCLRALRALHDLSGRAPERKKMYGRAGGSLDNTPKSSGSVATICPTKNCHALSFRSGRGYPPLPVSILYLYCYPKCGQNEGIFRAFEEKLRFTERSPLAINCLSQIARSSTRHPRAAARNTRLVPRFSMLKSSGLY